MHIFAAVKFSSVIMINKSNMFARTPLFYFKYLKRLLHDNVSSISQLEVGGLQSYEDAKVKRIVNVAIIGAPNSGKSTLINRIVNRRVCAASNKVHTTTNITRVMCVEDDAQIIFVDTPGVVSQKERKKFNLPDSMTTSCEKSLRIANVVGVIHDVSNTWTREALHPYVLKMLSATTNLPSFLILNKIDTLKSKRKLLDISRILTNGMLAGKSVPGTRIISKSKFQGYSNFSDVFMVSALNGDGVDLIKEYLKSNAKPARTQYDTDLWTDQRPELLIVEAVRAKFLDFLPQEIPYRLKSELEYYEEEEGKIVCAVIVNCQSERIAKLISGAGGGKLQQIRSAARQDLVSMFRKIVHLDLSLRVDGKVVF